LTLLIFQNKDNKKLKLLNNNETKYICGAGFVTNVGAILTGVEVFTAPANIAESAGTYGQWGSAVGEAAFNATHPDPMGQMTYTASDFAPVTDEKGK
jgi:hypothetical protein